MMSNCLQSNVEQQCQARSKMIQNQNSCRDTKEQNERNRMREKVHGTAGGRGCLDFIISKADVMPAE